MCVRIPQSIISMDDVQNFFNEKWAPEVMAIHNPGGAALDNILEDILNQISDIDVCEV